MSKKNTGLFIIIALVLVLALFAVLAATSSTGIFAAVSWYDSHYVAYCAGSSCGIS